jgi:hypothetical protein
VCYALLSFCCVQVKMAVSRKLCGAVIGQKGQTIRDFMLDSGATIRVQVSTLPPLLHARAARGRMQDTRDWVDVTAISVSCCDTACMCTTAQVLGLWQILVQLPLEIGTALLFDVCTAAAASVRAHPKRQ